MEKKNPKSDLWNDVVKAVVERKEALWNILEAKDETIEEICMDIYKEKRIVNKCIYQSKVEVNDEFRRISIRISVEIESYSGRK